MSATLSAAVEISDRVSVKFERMARSAKLFEDKLTAISRKLDNVQRRMDKLKVTSANPKLGLDTSEFERKLTAARIKMGMLDSSEVSPNVGGSVGIPGAPAVVAGESRGRNESTGRGNRRGNIDFPGLPRSIDRMVGGTYKAFKDLERIIDPFFKKVFTNLGGFFHVFGMVGEMSGGILAKMGPGFEMVGKSLTTLGPAIASVGANFVVLGIAAAGVMIIMGGLSEAIMILVSLVGSLLVPIAALLPILTSFVGLIAFGIVPVIILATQTKKLVTQKQALEKQLSTLTPGTKAYATTLQNLADTQKKLNQYGGENIYSKITGLLAKLKDAAFTPGNQKLIIKELNQALRAIEPLLSVVTNLIAGFTQVVAGLFRQLADYTNSPKGLQEIAGFFISALPVAQLLGQTIGKIGRMFMLLSAAVAPIATVLLKDFMHWIEGINNTLSSDSGMASLQKWLSDMYPVFKDMVIVVAEFVAGLVGMARDGAPLAIAFLSWLRDVGPKIKDWIESVASRWGPLFNDIIGTLGRLLGVFGDIVGFLADVLKPVVEVVFGKGGIFDEAVVVLEILTGALNQLPDLLGWVGDKFGKLGEIVGFVMDKIKWVMDHLGWLNKLDPRNWSGGHDPSKSVPLNPFLRGDNTAAVSPDGPTTVIVPPVGSGSPLTGVGGLTTNSRDTASKGVTIGAVHVYPADFDSFIQDMNRHMTNAPLEPDMAG